MLKYLFLSFCLWFCSITGNSQNIEVSVFDTTDERYSIIRVNDQEKMIPLFSIIGGSSYFVSDTVIFELHIFLESLNHSGNHTLWFSYFERVYPSFQLDDWYFYTTQSISSEDLVGLDRNNLPRIENGYLVLHKTSGEQIRIELGMAGFDFKKALEHYFSE